MKPTEQELKRRVFFGAIAGILWLLVFSGGILIDAEYSRIALGWRSQDTTGQVTVGRLAEQLVSPNTDSPNAVPVKPEDTIAVLSKAVEMEKVDEKKAKIAEAKGRWFFHNFAYGMLFFSPINVALLALLAGFVGGCFGNETDSTMIEADLAKAQKEKNEMNIRLATLRMHYLNESPFYSMIRSGVVYLIFISGLYVFTSDPFNPPTQAQGFTQYMRLAGMVSLLGFIVGYDPIRFQQWLLLIPAPSKNGQSEPGSPVNTGPNIIERGAVQNINVAQPGDQNEDEPAGRSRSPGAGATDLARNAVETGEDATRIKNTEHPLEEPNGANISGGASGSPRTP